MLPYAMSHVPRMLPHTIPCNIDCCTPSCHNQGQLHARWKRRKETLINSINIDRHLSGAAVQLPVELKDGAADNSLSGDPCEGEDLAESVATHSARAVLAQVHRVLSPGGSLCVVSYEPPRGRAWLLGDHATRVGWRSLVCGWEHVETGNYIYVLQKAFDLHP